MPSLQHGAIAKDGTGGTSSLDEFKAAVKEARQMGNLIHQVITRDSDLEDHLFTYLEESENQGWDGFTARDLYAIRRFLEDFGVYLLNQ